MSILQWWKRRRALDEEDLAEEIRAHLEMDARERATAGQDARSAQWAARKEFGNIAHTMADARRVWRPRWLEALIDLADDVRLAVRTLRKNPVFALTVMGVLTLGIGLNAAVFTMLKSMALSPLAGVAGSARLAVIHGETSTGREVAVSYPDYQYLRDHDQSFNGLMATSLVKGILGHGRAGHRVWVEMVTGNYFSVLGVTAARGRTILPRDEGAPGQNPVVVISDGLWRRDYGANPDILGQTIEINNFPLTVVGVADATYHGTIVSYDVEAYVPITMVSQLGVTFPGAAPAAILSDRRADFLYPHGFLRPGVTLEQAAARSGAAFHALASQRPLADAAQRLKVVRFYQSPNGAQTFVLPTLGVLAAMGLFVLLTACANIAGLVLVRGLGRRGEVAVRLALGATRARVVRLLLVENLVLAIPGAVVGVLLASRCIPWLVGYAEWLAAPERLFFNIEVDGFVIVYAALAGCVSALVFGLIPAIQTARVNLVTVINEDSSPRGAARGRLRAGLVVAQVAVSLLLLVGSGLVSRSLNAARGAYPGFDTKQTIGVGLDLRSNGYNQTQGLVFYRKLLDAARNQPGFESATLAQHSPLKLLDSAANSIELDGYQPKRGEELAFLSNAIGPAYFQTLKVPLMAGREFDDRDDATGAPVVIVNQAFAERFWGGAIGALGQRVRARNDGWRKVIGVAANLKYARVDEAPRPYFYLPYQQAYKSSMLLHARGRAPVHQLVDQARALVAKVDPELPIAYARPMSEITRGATIFLDLTATMLTLFGAAGMLLTALGTYGLVSYNVRNSAREIGIRMALGATGGSVVRNFLARGLRLTALGAGLGLAGALAATRLLGRLLYGVSPWDAFSYLTALAIVFAGVLFASSVPAWRASRTTPLDALRHH